MALGGRLQLTWAHQLRHRRSPCLDHRRLRWYRDPTLTYRLSAEYIVPSLLKPFARVTADGLERIPPTGPVILAANHRDNLDAYLLTHLVPRMVHTAARPDAFGTGPLCALWRRRNWCAQVSSTPPPNCEWVSADEATPGGQPRRLSPWR